MIALVASFFSLFVGPLVYQTFGPLRRTDKIVNGFIIVMVSCTILFEIIPDTYAKIGIFSIMICALGFFGPTLIEKTFRQAADTTHKLTILLGIAGLLVHAALDGIAIQTGTNLAQTSGLSLAIVLHRLPVGLTIWWILKPLLGERYALLTLFFMGLTTLIGFAGSQHIMMFKQSNILSIMQSLIAGSLLHVVIHKPHSDGCLHTSEEHEHHHAHQHSRKKSLQLTFTNLIVRWETIGYIMGLSLFLLLHTHYS